MDDSHLFAELEGLDDLDEAAEVLLPLYEDSRVEAEQRQMARNTMKHRALVMGQLMFEQVWRDSLPDVNDLGDRIAAVFHPYRRTRRRR